MRNRIIIAESIKKVRLFFYKLLKVTAAIFAIPFIITLIFSGLGNGREGLKNKTFSQDECIVRIMVPAIDISDNKEFLKAMAVMCRTYLNYCNENNVEKEVKIYTDDEMLQRWQDKTDEVKTKLEKAVKETDGQYMTNNKKAIYPYMHLMTSGYTRNDKCIDYLCEVDCIKDSLCDDYISIIDFTNEEFVKKIKSNNKNISFCSDEPACEVQLVSKSAGGYVIDLQVGNIMIDGDSMADLFDLPSSSFVVSRIDNGVRFTVKGRGSGYGMSLRSALRFANENMTYKEILNYFFKNIFYKKD